MTTGTGAGLRHLGQALDPMRLSQAIQGFQQIEQRRQNAEFLQKDFIELNKRVEQEPEFKKLYTRFRKQHPQFDPSNLAQYKVGRDALRAAEANMKMLSKLKEKGIIHPELADMMESQVFTNPVEMSKAMSTQMMGHFARKQQSDDMMKQLAVYKEAGADTSTAEKMATINPQIAGQIGLQAHQQGQLNQQNIEAMNTMMQDMNLPPEVITKVQEFQSQGPAGIQQGLKFLSEKLEESKDKKAQQEFSLAALNGLNVYPEEFINPSDIKAASLAIAAGQYKLADRYTAAAHAAAEARSQGQIDVRLERKAETEKNQMLNNLMMDINSTADPVLKMAKANKAGQSIRDIATNQKAFEKVFGIADSESGVKLTTSDFDTVAAAELFSSAVKSGVIDPDDSQGEQINALIEHGFNEGFLSESKEIDDKFRNRLIALKKVAEDRQMLQSQQDVISTQEFNKALKEMKKRGLVKETFKGKNVLVPRRGGIDFNPPVRQDQLFANPVSLVYLPEEDGGVHYDVNGVLYGSDGSIKDANTLQDVDPENLKASLEGVQAEGSARLSDTMNEEARRLRMIPMYISNLLDSNKLQNLSKIQRENLISIGNSARSAANQADRLSFGEKPFDVPQGMGKAAPTPMPQERGPESTYAEAIGDLRFTLQSSLADMVRVLTTNE